MSIRPQGLPPIPEQTVRVAQAAFPKGSLAMGVRDRLAEVFHDEPFAEAFGVRGAPGLSPGVLALVTVLQFAEDLTDRQAAAMAIRAIDWKYAIGAELTDTGFDASVLSRFRARLVEHGMERLVFDRMLEHCRDAGLVKTGGKQRTDSTHVISAVRDLNRLELAGESVRAALEALAVAAPDWLAQSVDITEMAHRYGPRVDTWRMPSSKTKRDRLAQVFGQDGLMLCRAVHAPSAPVWLRQIEAVDVLRQVLVQTYYVHADSRGREVITKREAEDEGVPPGHLRLASPYDSDTRWAAKGDFFWNGFKIHLTETCRTRADITADGTRVPNLITDVATTDATVPDVKATASIHRRLAERKVLPAEHYLDSGYPSADLIHAARQQGVALVTPAMQDHSSQGRAGDGFDKAAFTVDWRARQVSCPAGHTSINWSPTRQRGREVIVVKFGADSCDACPNRARCTASQRGRRQLTLYPKELQQALKQARTEQKKQTWKDKYALRAGVEGTINQALDLTGLRQARYRGLPKVRLQHAFSATAINIIRLDAWWNGHPLDHVRTSNLARLAHTLAA